MRFADYTRPFIRDDDDEDPRDFCPFDGERFRNAPSATESWRYCGRCRATTHARDCHPDTEGCTCGYDALHERIDRAGELALIEGDTAQLHARRGS